MTGLGHQTEHFFSGFILLPTGQLKSTANWGLLERLPKTRKRPGEWDPVKI
jgi:hypothetical protein